MLVTPHFLLLHDHMSERRITENNRSMHGGTRRKTTRQLVTDCYVYIVYKFESLFVFRFFKATMLILSNSILTICVFPLLNLLFR
jgi:hypothetical protein